MMAVYRRHAFSGVSPLCDVFAVVATSLCDVEIGRNCGGAAVSH